MPRLRQERSPYEGYTGMILGRMKGQGITIIDMAARLGVTPNTMSRYIKEPGGMRLDTIRKLHRILGIPAEEARDRIPMW